ncbi:MAG: hypothetical protein U0X20_00180 [Caldilineaceae bacterium]
MSASSAPFSRNLVARSCPLSPRVAFWLAFRCGGLRGVLLRSSARSFSGVVLVCGFSSFASAARLASRLAQRMPGAAAPRVRRVAGRSGSGWAVSVPVALPVLGVAALGVFPVRGGVVPAAALARRLA